MFVYKLDMLSLLTQVSQWSIQVLVGWFCDKEIDLAPAQGMGPAGSCIYYPTRACAARGKVIGVGVHIYICIYIIMYIYIYVTIKNFQICSNTHF